MRTPYSAAMKLGLIETEHGPQLAECALRDGVAQWSRICESLPADVVRAWDYRDRIETADREPVADPRVLCPLDGSSTRVFCIGLNYRDHARETNSPIPTAPIVFSKFASALTHPGDPIVLPRVSDRVDFEAELVVVIGREGKHITESHALDHVFGYCCGHDVSARDWQKDKPGKQWLLGKTFDTFAPLGPFIATADEVADPHSLGVRCRINGETMQDGTTADLIFGVAEIVSYLSQVVRLQPGDVIFTGTPAGVGDARTPPRYLQDGDTVEVEIDGLGTLSNPVVAEDGASIVS